MSITPRSLTRKVLATAFGAFLAFVPAIAQNASQLGTVKSVSGNTVTITTKAGAPITVTLIPEATVLELDPGVTDIKQAKPGTAADITVGDRVLATGKPGDTADILVAQRIILMKATALAARNQADQADWKKRGVSGIVKSVTGDVVVISSAGKTINVQTTAGTVVRRYADDSVKFEDAKPSAVASIKAGDQLQARGPHAADNLSITADEIIDGSFANLSGVITAIDPTLGTVTFKDLTTKKAVTIKLTANSEIKKIDPGMAARFLGGGAGGPGGAPGGGAPGGGAPGGGGGYGGGGYGGGGAPGGGGYGGGGAPGGAPRAGGAPAGGSQRVSSTARRGADLTRMMAMLPAKSLSDLKPGDAVMVVASQPTGGNPAYTAITMLGGVEQILAAKPENGEAITLQPFNMGEGEMGGGGMGGPGGPGGGN